MNFRKWNPSRSTKALLVGAVCWTAFVILRTSGDYEVLGLQLDYWQQDQFFINWLVVPIVFGVLLYAIKWALRAKRQPIHANSKNHPMDVLAEKMERWEPGQRKMGYMLIKATMDGDEKKINEVSSRMTVNNFRDVCDAIKEVIRD